MTKKTKKKLKPIVIEKKFKKMLIQLSFTQKFLINV